MFYDFLYINHIKGFELPICMPAVSSAEAAQKIFDYTLPGINWTGKELKFIPYSPVSSEINQLLKGVPHEFR